MTCNSVAVSSAMVSQVAMDSETLKGMLASITGMDAGKVEFSHWDAGDKALSHRKTITMRNDQDQVSVTYRGVAVWITQRVVNGTVKLTLGVSGTAIQGALVAQVRNDLTPLYERQAIRGQQAAVLKRLAALGKLSNVQTKDGGITARVVIEI